jgi:hypothetical protein
MDAYTAWKESFPLLDKVGRRVAQARPAHLFFKHKALIPHHPIFMREYRYWKRPTREGVYPDFDGYLLVQVKEVSGFSRGVQMIPLDKSGRIITQGNLKVRLMPFIKGVEIVSDAFRVLDVPSNKVMHIAPSLTSAFAASLVKGQRTWAPVFPEALNSMDLPSNLEEVWLWREQGNNDLSSFHCDQLVSSLLVKGIVVHIMDLNPYLKEKTWGDAYRAHGIYACADRKDRFKACLKIAHYECVSEFGLITKNA